MKEESIQSPASLRRQRPGSLWPPLIAALICTGLILEAIHTLFGSRGNGDLMVMVCPILGAIFLSIPAAQAWWACVKILRRRM